MDGKPMAQSRRKSTTKSKSRTKSKAKSKAPTRAAPSPERNINLGGFVLTGLGLISALGLFSNRSTRLLGAVYTLLRQGFGWGAYFLPLLLVAAGLLILLRNLEGAPKLSSEQRVGAILLYLAGLTSLQYFTFPFDMAASRYIASTGIGGGFLGV